MLRLETTLPTETEHLIHRVIGCAIVVHKTLGAGYPEKAYSRAIGLEFAASGIPYEREKLIRVAYRDQIVCHFRLDLLVGDALVVEIKSVDRLKSVHRSQVIGYLKASGLRAGLLLNFKVGAMPDGTRRVVL